MQIKQRTLPKSLSCGKTFRSQTALTKIDDVHHWLAELGKELAERVGEDRWASGGFSLGLSNERTEWGS